MRGALARVERRGVGTVVRTVELGEGRAERRQAAARQELRRQPLGHVARWVDRGEHGIEQAAQGRRPDLAERRVDRHDPRAVERALGRLAGGIDELEAPGAGLAMRLAHRPVEQPLDPGDRVLRQVGPVEPDDRQRSGPVLDHAAHHREAAPPHAHPRQPGEPAAHGPGAGRAHLGDRGDRPAVLPAERQVEEQVADRRAAGLGQGASPRRADAGEGGDGGREVQRRSRRFRRPRRS